MTTKDVSIDYIQPSSEATTRRRANTTIAQSASQSAAGLSIPPRQLAQLAASTSFKDLKNEAASGYFSRDNNNSETSSSKERSTLTVQTDGYPASGSINSTSSNISTEDPTLTVKDTPRDEILRQIFGDVGELIVDFSCAVESTVLLHGRMYITNKYLCFYSNLFGLEKKIRIPYSHITAITKENTALVIPNAIAIRTYRKDYLFRSFWDREECFKTLKEMVSKFTRKVPVTNSPEGKSSVSAIVSSATLSPTGGANIPAAVVSQHGHTRSQSMYVTSTGQPIVSRAQHAENPSPTQHHTQSALDAENTDDNEEDHETNGNLVTKSGDVISDFTGEVAKNSLKTSVISSELPINLDTFVKLYVAEGAAHSYPKYHELVGDTRVEASSWTGDMGSNLGAGREIKFFKPVNLPGLKSTRGVKVQKCKRFGNCGLVLLSSTRLEDVPMASSFTVEDMVTVKAMDSNRVLVEISFEVKFIKNLNAFFRYTVDSSTSPEMTKWLQAFFANHLKLHSKGQADATARGSVDNIAEGSILSIKKVSTKRDVLSPLSTFLEHLSVNMDGFRIVWVLAALCLAYQYMRLNSTISLMRYEMHHTSEMLATILEYQKHINSTIAQTQEAMRLHAGMCGSSYASAMDGSSLPAAVELLTSKVHAVEAALLKR